MDALRHVVLDALAAAPPPPPPASVYILEENVPDILAFLGFTVFGISLLFAATEVLEQDTPRYRDLDYAACPVYMLLGLAVGLMSYSLAFFTHITLGSYGHLLFTTAMFFFFTKHITHRAEMQRRRASALIMIGGLPLLCLSVLEAGTVRVRSAKFFFALMLVFSAMPLPYLFREWLPVGAGAHSLSFSGDPGSGKLRKRLFSLFFFAFCFVFASTPVHGHRQETIGEGRQSVVVFFDLVMVYFSLDGLWN